MSLATFPAQPSSAQCTVAFASASALVLDTLTPGERREYDRLPSENEARLHDWRGLLLMKMLGFALAVAVLLDATVMRLAVSPALLVLAGRWNWWPGERTDAQVCRTVRLVDSRDVTQTVRAKHCD